MIQILTQSELQELVTHPDRQNKYRPKGMFLSHENGMWVACDNSEGDAWTEEFDTLEDAVDWLNSDVSKEEFESRRKPAFQNLEEPTALAYTGDKIPEVQRPKKIDPLDKPVTIGFVLDFLEEFVSIGGGLALSLGNIQRFRKQFKEGSHA